MLISIPSAVGLAVLSRPIVLILFPQMESLALASSLLRCISITVVLYSLSTLTNTILQGIGNPKLPVINALISLAVQTIVLVILLLNTRLDLYVLAISTILYSFLICLLNAISLRKILGYRMNIKNNFLIPIEASCVMGALAFLIYLALYTLFHSNIFALSIAITSGAILYFYLVIKLGGITEDELTSLPKGDMLVTLAKKLRAL
jgi:stage V sporulation protein B